MKKPATPKEKQDCPYCKGTGLVAVDSGIVVGGMLATYKLACEECEGVGKVWTPWDGEP